MRRSSPNLLHFWLLLASLCLLVPAGIHDAAANTASPQDPQPLISERISALLTRLRDNSAAIHKDPNVAYQISDEMIAPYIDFPRITRLVIGKYWNDASGAQREQLTEEISSLLTRSYVTAMTSYIDELTREDNMIEFLPSRYQPGDVKASVRANIALGGRAPAAVQYQLYYVDQWKIYDIHIEGISLALTYRTSFGEKIKRNGIEQLIAELAERNRRGEVELPPEATNKQTH